jgi:hypothetical protein
MSLITTIKNKLTGHHAGCCCGHEQEKRPEQASKITKDMIVRDVTGRWPQTINVFGKHKVDFCCGGAHSIEQTAQAKGCRDIDALVADLNTAIQ